MEDNNNPIYIIENQNEQNVDQILDINNENLSDRNNQNESIQNININDSPNISLNEEKNVKQKGYVRIFRNILKKKDDLRKKLLKDCFLNWQKETLKGLTIKKKIFVRLSLSKGKDEKSRQRKNSDFEDEVEKVEKEKSRSVNKREIKIKGFNKPPAVPQPIYNIRREKLENEDNKDKSLPNEEKNKYNKNNDNKFKTMGQFEIAKKIKNYKGRVDDKDKIKNKNIKNNNQKKNNTNYTYIIPKNKKIIHMSDEKRKAPIKINNTNNNNDKTKNIYPINNLNVQFAELNNSTKKSNNKLNSNNISNINNNNYIRRKIESQNLHSSYKKDQEPVNQKQYNNIGIIYTSSSKKNKKYVHSNSITYKNNTKDYKPKKETSKGKNDSQGYYTKYEGYHHDNKKLSTNTEPKNIQINFRERKDIIKNEFNPYQYNQFNQYSQYTNNKRKIKDNNNFYQLNQTDYKSYQRSTYQASNKKEKSNDKISTGIYTRRDQNNFTYSLKTAKPAIKSGITTVIQHFSGRRNQYEKYSQNASKYQNSNYKK